MKGSVNGYGFDGIRRIEKLLTKKQAKHRALEKIEEGIGKFEHYLENLVIVEEEEDWSITSSNL